MNMAESCTVNSEISRKSQTEILRRLASAGQNAAANSIGKSETWVSRFASDQLKTFTDLLSALGLKVVPADHRCYSADYIEHLHYFARLGMAESKPELVEDFDE
jgi:hypothetical protein